MAYTPVAQRNKEEEKNPFLTPVSSFKFPETQGPIQPIAPELPTISNSTPERKYIPVAQRFGIGEGMDNTTKVLPGPRVSTLEAIQRGDEIETIPVGGKEQIAPATKASQVAFQEGYIPVGLRIKLPFLQKGINVPDDSFSEMLKDFVESPEKLFKSAQYLNLSPEQKEQFKIKDEAKIFQTRLYQDDYKDMVDRGVNPVGAFILTGINVAVDASIFADLVGKPLLKVISKTPVSKKVVQSLTWKDLSDITRGKVLSNEKMSAFNQLSNEGIDWAKTLKKSGNKIEVQISEGKTLGQWVKEQKLQPGLSIKDVAKTEEKALAKSEEIKKLNPVERPIKSLISIDTDREMAKRDIAKGERSMTDLPVLIEKQADGSFVVQDGNHRIVQALEEGKTSILTTTNEKEYLKLAEKLEKEILEPKTIESEISKAKASGKSFDEFSKGIQPASTLNTFEINQALPTPPKYIKAYHGTSNKNADSILKNGYKINDKQRFGRYTGDGVYFSPEKGGTARFSDGGKELDGYIDIENFKTVYLPETNIDWQPGNEIVREWKSKYDGVIVRIKDTNTETKNVEADFINEIVVYNTDKIKTKSQLKQLWDKQETYDKIQDAGGVARIQGTQPIQQKTSIQVKYKKDGTVVFPGETIESPADVAFAFKELRNEAVEKFYAVGIKNNKPITVELISTGTLNASLVHPRETLGLLIEKGADSAYYIHNHPSGNIDPSEADIQLMGRLASIGKKLDIEFKGGIIIDTEKFAHFNTYGTTAKFKHKEASKNPKKVSTYKKYLDWTSKELDITISKAKDIYELGKGINLDDKNNILVAYLNSRNQVISTEILPKEGLTSAQIFKKATKTITASIVIVGKELIYENIPRFRQDFTQYGIELLDAVNIDIKGENFISILGEEKPEYKTGKQQLAEREQAKVDREQAILKRDSLIFNGELETQYQSFKKLKTKVTEDVAQLKAKNKGAEIDNILYSQEKTNNDVYEMFLDRYAKEKEALPQVPKETKAVTAEKARATATQKARETRDRIVANIKAKQGTAIAVKQEIVDFAKTLDLKERGKLLATVKNAKTFNDLDKARDYIIRLGESAESRKLTNAIQKSLKATIAKGAKPKGKYTPEIQATLDSIRSIVGVNQKQANLKLESNLEKFADKMPVEVAMENHLLSLYTGTIAEKAELLSIINGLREKGEIASSLKKFNIQSDIIAKQDLIVERVTGGKGIESGRLKGEPIDKTTKQKVQQYFKTIGKKTILDWQGLMIASDFNVSVKEKPLEEFFSLGKNESKYKELQARYKEDFDIAVSDIYGIKNKPNSILKKIHQLRDKVVIDNIEMTRDELIKRYMEIQDPTLIDSFKEGNKYTDKTLAEIESKISKEDKDFAIWQLDYLQKFYKKVNAVYSKMTGVNLPFNEFYSPIKRVGVDLKPGHTEFLDEAVYRKAVTNKSLISRVKNIRPIAKQSSISALDRHITDSNYYIAWAEKIRELDSIFTNNNVREAYRQELPSILSSIDNKIQHISTHGNKTASRIGWVDYIRKNYVVGNLAVKPALTIKQLVSILAYAEKISSVQLVSGIIDFAKNPIKNYNTLKNESTFIKTRGLGMERDIREAMKEGVFDRYNKKQTLANNLLLNVKLGDKGAIVLGSWAMRKARLKAGDKLSNVIDEYEEFGANTQQSADISRLSEIQLGGSIEKLFTVFKTSQRAYLQKELNVVKSMFRKDGFGKENIKKVAKTLWIYHILLPVFFQWISNMGGWDDDDKKDYLRAGLLGSLNGLFIAGDVIDGVIRQVLGMRVWDSEVIVADIGDDVNKVISNLTEDDVSIEDLQQAMDALASAGTGATGLPLEYSYDFLESIYNGNYETGLLQLSGWSEYTIGAGKKKTRVEEIEARIEKVQRKSKLEEFEARIKEIESR